MNENSKEKAEPQATAAPQFSIQRLYVKDISFESPKSPLIFKEPNWNPNINLELHTQSKPLDASVYEVTLRVTVTAKLKEESAFVVEVEQAGIFSITGFEPDPLQRMLGSFCPNILFPYAREVVTRQVQDGGFPPLYLAPINFDALYEEHQKQLTKKRQEQAAAPQVH